MRKTTANWLASADYDLETADAMLKSRRYLYVVFMCHLALEKTLKALYTVSPKGGKFVPLQDEEGDQMVAQGLTPDTAVAAFCKELRRLRIRPRRILLFGSWARQEQHEGSDIDVLVISPDFSGKGLRKRLELLGIAAARALVPVQALGYTPEEFEAREPGGFLDEILSSEVVPIDNA